MQPSPSSHPVSSCLVTFVGTAIMMAILGSSILFAIFHDCNTPPEAPASVEIASEPSATIKVTQTITLQPSFSSEDGVNASRVEVCYTLESGQTIRLLVKGDPPIANGGFISVSMTLASGIELMFLEPATRIPPEVYTGSDTIKSYWIPGDQEQEVLMLARNAGGEASSACLQLSYEHPPEPEPDPENKGMNDPPLPEVSTTAPTPKAL